MTADRIIDAIKRSPFKPFRLRTADSRRFEVRDARYACVSPNRRTVLVFKTNGSCEQIDIPTIESIESLPERGEQVPLKGGRRGSMTAEKIKESILARPFRPFRLHTADGRKHSVPHPEFAAIARTGRTVVVYGPADELEIIDVVMVQSIEFLTERDTKRRRKAG